MTSIHKKRQALLRKIGEAHYEWLDRVNESTVYNTDDKNPHDGKTSDYAVHALDRSATAIQEKLFQDSIAKDLEKLKRL